MCIKNLLKIFKSKAEKAEARKAIKPVENKPLVLTNPRAEKPAKKSDHKAEVSTKNINGHILPTVDIITERPQNMSQEEYREKRTIMNKQISRRIKEGFLVYKAAEIYKEKRKINGKETEVDMLQHFRPFRGKVAKLKIK